MELNEAKQLIPFYVANTLSPEEKAELEEALKVSKELNDDLAFWRKAEVAAQAHAEYAARHLSSEQIVDYAERTTSDPALRSQIESHLQACKECREEFDMIMQTMPEVTPSGTLTLLEKASQLITSFKPIYALPVAAVLIAVVVLWRTFETKEFVPDENTMRLVLPFQSQMRGEEESLPILVMNENLKHVSFVLCIPHDSLPATQYTATLSTPQGKAITLPEQLSKIAALIADSVKLSIEAASLNAEGVYTLAIAEVPSTLPPGATPFPPEPYRFRITHVSPK